MASILNSQCVVLATCMVAVSSTLILFAFKLQKSHSNSKFQVKHIPRPLLRPCLSSGERKLDKKRKRVRFAEDVIDPTGDNEMSRRQYDDNNPKKTSRGEDEITEMPPNRVALYNGILRDRVNYRVTYSH